MKNGFVAAVSVAAVLLILAAVVYVQASVWIECRATHSWLYCFRLISR